MHAVSDGQPVSDDALKLMRLVDRGEVGRLLRLRVRPAVVHEVEGILDGYAASLLGRESDAWRVIRELHIEYDYEPES